jgi:hypothetical protein
LPFFISKDNGFFTQPDKMLNNFLGEFAEKIAD